MGLAPGVARRVAGPAPQLYWPTYAAMLQLAACRSTEAIVTLTFETREPDDDEVVRLPRSVFWED